MAGPAPEGEFAFGQPYLTIESVYAVAGLYWSAFLVVVLMSTIQILVGAGRPTTMI